MLTSRILIVATAGLAAAGCRKKDKQPPAPPVVAAPIDAAAPEPAAGIVAVDVPPGYDYPAPRAEVQAWADAWSIDKITAKAWNLWGGMTAASGQRDGGAELPVWETWCGNEEVFTKTCGAAARPTRRFRNAVQLGHTGQAGDVRLASFNKFNPPMAAFFATAQPGPGGVTYDYTQQASLAALNQGWPAGTPIAQRKIVETPYVPPGGGQQGLAAIETKPVMFLVKKTGLSPVPLWRGLAGALPSSNCAKGPSPQCHPAPNLWTTCVLVDPAAPAGADTAPIAATPAQIAQIDPSFAKAFACQTYLYAPLSTIYAFAMNAQEAAEFNTAQGNGGTAVAGDYAVLTAMHVNTKEIVDWTWQTFWWQPGADPPDNFPGSKAGMTDKVRGAWRNYAMCTTYLQTQGKASTSMVVCFNPFLETSSGIPDGTQSNCMSCHGTATVGSTIDPKNGIATLSYPAAYTTPIDFTTDPRFAPFTRTDFSWAVPVDAQPPATP